MKFKSILLYISNIESSSSFYQKLGFKIDAKDDKSVTVSLENLQLQLFDKEKVEFKQDSEINPRGIGIFFYIEVNDVDEKHKELISKGLTSTTTPKDWPWGNREFVIKDPDGYKFVIYKKI